MTGSVRPLTRAMGRRWFVVGAAFSAISSLVFFLWMLLVIGGPRITDGVDDIAELVAAWIAASLCALAAVRSRENGPSWTLVATSCFAWGVGEALWSYFDLVDRTLVPFPSLADAGFVTAIPFMILGLLFFSHSSERTIRRFEGLLDGCIIAAALLYASWATILGPIYRSHQGGVLKQVLSLTYPTSDAVMLALVIILVARAGRRRRIPLGLVMAGVVAFTIADSSFAYLTEVNNYGIGNFLDTGWVAGYLLIALGALWEISTGSFELARTETSTVSLVAPYAPVLVILAVTAVEILRGRHFDPVAWLMALAVVLLVLAREGLKLWDRATGHSGDGDFPTVALGK